MFCSKRSTNPEIKKLSEQQQKLNVDLNSIKDKKHRHELRTKRNRILTSIHNQIKAEETKQIRTKTHKYRKPTKRFEANV